MEADNTGGGRNEQEVGEKGDMRREEREK